MTGADGRSVNVGDTVVFWHRQTKYGSGILRWGTVVSTTDKTALVQYDVGVHADESRQRRCLMEHVIAVREVLR